MVVNRQQKAFVLRDTDSFVKLSTTSLIQFAMKIGVTIAGFVSTIVFARVLGADVLGTYFLAIAVIGWLEFASQLGVTTSIQKRVSEQNNPAAYFAAGGLILAFTTFGVTAVLLLAHDWVASYVGGNIVSFIAVMLLMTVLHSLANAGLRGYHRVSMAATLELITTVVRVILQVALVIAGFGLIGMLVGYTVAFGAMGVLGIYLIVSEDSIAQPARRHIASTLDFAKFAWLGSLKSRVSGWMDTLVLGFFVTNGLVGIYNVSWNLAIILTLASQSLYSALFPALSQLDANHNHSAFSSILSEALRYAGILCFPGIIGLALVGSSVLRVYGSEFTDGAIIAVLISVFALFSSYQGQFQTALNALNRPDLSFRVNALFVVVNVTGNIVLVATVGWIGAAVATTVSMGVALVYSYVLTNRHVNVGVPIRDVGHQIAAATIMGVVVYAVENAIAPLPYYFVIIPIGVGVIIYFLVLLSISQPVRKKTFEILDGWRAAL